MASEPSLVGTQVLLTREQVEALRILAARRGVSVAELVRHAVDAWLASQGEDRGGLRRRALEVVGRYGSGRTDVSRNHDRYLEDSFHS